MFFNCIKSIIFLYLNMKQNIELHGFTLFSIGHGNRKSDEFLRLLLAYEIETIVDVRTFPYSRYNPHFRRKELETLLKNRGIEYLFLGNELGGRPKRPDLYKNEKLDYSLIRETDLFKNGICKVAHLVREKVKVTLMCSETDPNECHRKHLLADEFIKLGIEVLHINKYDILEKHTQCNPTLF